MVKDLKLIEEKIPELREKINEKRFLSNKAGSFSGVPQRTVQTWTEKGLIQSETTGTGDRRKYSVIDCIEIGIIKSLTKVRLPFSAITNIMERMHAPNEKLPPFTLSETMFFKKGCYLLLQFGYKQVTVRHVIGINESSAGKDELLQWFKDTADPESEKVLVVNVSRIIESVFEKIQKEM